MPNPLVVQQIVLKAGTAYGGEITVSLYSGDTVAGQCQSHTGSYGTETLSCSRAAADRVRLTVKDTRQTRLYVYEIRVTAAITKTIGL